MIAPVASIHAMGSGIAVSIAGHLGRTLRAALGDGVNAHESGFFQLISGDAHPMGNFAFIFDGADLASVKKATPALVECGSPAAVLFPNDVSTEVLEYLGKQKFMGPETMPVMAVEIENLAATGLPDGYRFELATGRREADAWVAGLAEGFGLPESLAARFSPSVIVPETPHLAVQHYAVFRGEQAVATSLLCLAEGVAGVYCVGTRVEERGKGLGAHVTAEPLRLAREMGYHVGVLQSSLMGHGVYRRLGFMDQGEMPMFVYIPEG